MDVRAVRAALIRKLEAIEDRARHHVFFYLDYDGRRYLGSKMSHSWRGDLDDQQIDWVKKPLLLSKSEFDQLVDCPMTKNQFFEVWIGRKGLR